MSILTSESKLQAVDSLDGLVEHLRCAGRGVDPQRVAAEFGYSAQFVSQVLEALAAPQFESRKSEHFWKSVARILSQGWDKLKELWLKCTDSPFVFVLATLLAGVLLSYGVLMANPQAGAVVGVDFGEILSWVFVLHFACFARHGMLRYPIFSAGIVALGAYLLNIRVATAGPNQALSLLAASLLIGSLYAFLGSVAALVGGFVAVRRRARTIHTLSRQEALERLFFLKERLGKLGPKLERASTKASWLDRRHSDAHWPLVAFVGGLALGALRVLILGGYQHLFPNDGKVDHVFTAFRVFSIVVTGLSFLGIGFISGDVRKAVASQFLAYAAMLLTNFIHLGVFGFAFAVQQLEAPRLLAMVPLLLLSGLLSGFGAQIEDSARRKRRLDSNDPASLVAEMVLLQRRLNAESAARCVLSVDVARSTAMKADQDPLVVEWSFREYHKLLQECAEDSGGQVLSTAGDGAVLTFADCGDALRAARDIHTRLSWFNMRVNRLDSPFRVRIGLHADEVQGELKHVQFTHVIDIAAHVQNQAPIGGILVTSPVASQLPDEGLTELKDNIEGHMVMLVVNPTMGA